MDTTIAEQRTGAVPDGTSPADADAGPGDVVWWSIVPELAALAALAAVAVVLTFAMLPAGAPAMGGAIAAAFVGTLALLALRRALATAAAMRRNARLLGAANRELAVSRQRFRDFAEAASDWFWETGPDHRYTLLSERVAILIGGEPRDVFGDGLADLGRLATDPMAWTDAQRDIGAGRGFRDLELGWTDETGKAFVFRVSAQPVYGDDGAFLGYRGSGVDATLEVLALRDARTTQILVHDALESISEGFVLFNPEGRLLFCNDRYRSAYPNLADRLVPGVSFEEVLRAAAERGGFGQDHGDLGSWIRERLARHLETTVPVDRRLSDGHWYRISEHATRSGGIVKLLMDITELKEREQELAGRTERLRESEARYRQLVDLAPFGVVLWDRAAIRFANPAAAAILGAPHPLELDGAPLAPCFADGERLAAQLAGFSGPGGQRLEAEAVHADGERRQVEIAAYPAAYDRNDAVLLVINDVTERRRAETELRRAQKMEAVGRMAGGVAHEFNNMLTAIGGFARLAERTPGDVERVRTCVTEIAKASDRAAALTAQLLDFSRRRVSDELETVALTDVVRDLRVFLKPLLNDGIDLSVDVRDPGLHAIANPVTLTQAILNLAINARDAMPDGGRLTVTLEAIEPDAAFRRQHDGLEAGRYAVIRVTDTGSGIAEEIRDRIWEPFFTTKEPGKGTGLGLWMVYGTARQAGGAVEMTSSPGGGSVFSIYLPRVQAPVGRPAPAPLPLLPEGEAASILLVDDEPAVRAYLTLVLTEAGCRVVQAEDGVDALEKYDAHGGLFDCLVTDLAMPHMGGPELVAELARRNPNLPVLFLSGYASHEKAAALLAVAGRKLLMKPISPEDLIQGLREVMAE
ncbi:hybrid sensor histidine kinase/response regulator [Azospirillum oleiclasticum]